MTQAPTVPSTGPPQTLISIREISDPDLLRALWKDVRKRLRQMRFQDFLVARDTLEFLGFEWALTSNIEELSASLRSGAYRATQAEYVRAAKSVGLTRPLASLAPRDALVYKAIVSRSEPHLMSHMKPWTKFGRSDTRRTDESGADSGWFRAWLARQAQLWTMTGTHSWVVESDVTNYFPTVDIVSLREHVLARGGIDERVSQLLRHLLVRFAPMDGYRTPPAVGLPQDDFDCSRILAHTYLKDIDEEFDDEGATGRYSRWMDDIAIGTDTWQEALKAVSRLQKAMEPLGLTPNARKTRIIRAADFVRDYLKDENDELGVLDGAWNESLFVARAKPFVRPAAPRPKAWEQVLRRYYTLGKQHRVQYLKHQAMRHLAEVPTSARHIFEYLSTFHATTRTIAELRSRIDSLSGVYEDIDVLAFEYLAVAPNLESRPLREAAADWALEVVSQKHGSSPRVASSAALVAGKFGLPTHLAALDTLFTEMKSDSPARQQTLTVLLGSGHRRLESLEECFLPHGSGSAIEHRSYLVGLRAADSRAVGLALGLIQPIERQNPGRWAVRPRALFLAPLVREVAPKRAHQPLTQWIAKLDENLRRHHDAASLRWLQQPLTHAPGQPAVALAPLTDSVAPSASSPVTVVGPARREGLVGITQRALQRSPHASRRGSRRRGA